jgi:hypothetical protein
MLWGLVLALPAGCYCFCTFPYGGGYAAGPAVVLAGPVAGALVAFPIGAAVGLYRAGYRWLLLMVPALSAAMVLAPYALYADQQSKEDDFRRLVREVEEDDPAPLLAELRAPRSRAVAEDHLEQLLVCGGLSSRADVVVDALATLDPHGKDGYALCAVAQHGQPATVSHLLGEGFQPGRAHRLNGAPCNPLHDLVEGSRGTAPCWGDFEELSGTPTAQGCEHRAQVAALLVEAGAAPDGDAGIHLNGCEKD